MIWTAGVAVSLTVSKLVNELNVDAWNRLIPYSPQTAGMAVFDFIIAIVYGTCLTLFLIAARTRDFWKSPGKIILMIFAMICIIDWSLTVFADSMIIQHISVIQGPPPVNGLGAVSDVSYVTANGYVFGYYYQSLPGQIGYWLGIPLLLFTLFRSREESKLWKFVWTGFLCFTILMLLEFTGWRAQWLNFPPGYMAFHFFVAIGIPMVAVFVAFTSDLIRKREVDWWTTLTCTLLPVAWLAMVALNLFNYFS